MLYAILCYHDEAVVSAWTKEKDDAVMAKRAVVTRKLAAAGQARPGRAPDADDHGDDGAVRPRALVIDGPFAETKEQLLGFYVVDCATLEEAIEAARRAGARRTRRPRDPSAPPLRAGEPPRSDRHRLDRRGADLGAAAGDRRAAALFPRSRSGRGGVPGGLPARAARTGRRTARRAIRPPGSSWSGATSRSTTSAAASKSAAAARRTR